MNHYSKRAVCEWLFTAMCGINGHPVQGICTMLKK